MSGEFFLAALRRVANGEDPDLLYAELWGNAEIEDFRDNQNRDYGDEHID